MAGGPLSPYSLRRIYPGPEAEPDDASFRALLEPPAADHSFIDLAQLWKTIRKRLYIAIAIPAVLVVVVGIRGLLQPNLYTASSTILIRGSAPQLFSDSNGIQSNQNAQDYAYDPDMFLNTKYELLHTSGMALRT